MKKCKITVMRKACYKDLMKKYEEKFRYPERFYKTPKGIEAKAYKPVSKDMER